MSIMISLVSFCAFCAFCGRLLWLRQSRAVSLCVLPVFRSGFWAKPVPQLFGLFEIAHPIDAESIRDHAEPSAPERVLQRHRNLAFFAERSEKSLCFLHGLGLEADREVV